MKVKELIEILDLIDREHPELDVHIELEGKIKTLDQVFVQVEKMYGLTASNKPQSQERVVIRRSV